MSKAPRQTLMIISALAALTLDLISKTYAHTYLKPSSSVAFIPDIINFNLVTNSGFAFSLGQGHQILAKIIAGIVFTVLVIIYIRRYWSGVTHPWLEQLGMSIIIGSAFGNLLERFCFGQVTDFFEFAFINFPVFNFADALIDVGIVLVLISIYFARRSPDRI